MTRYTSYLEDTVWCNDRSISDLSGWDPNGNISSSQLRFKSNSYLDKYNISCKNKIDRFTVSGTNGNGALTYPVGLIDYNEVLLCHYLGSSPLNSGSICWGISPTAYDRSGAGIYRIYTDGSYTAADVDEEFGVRPAVSLKEGMTYSEGNGSSDKPFVVDSLPDTFE